MTHLIEQFLDRREVEVAFEQCRNDAEMAVGLGQQFPGLLGAVWDPRADRVMVAVARFSDKKPEPEMFTFRTSSAAGSCRPVAEAERWSHEREMTAGAGNPLADRWLKKHGLATKVWYSVATLGMANCPGRPASYAGKKLELEGGAPGAQSARIERLGTRRRRGRR